MKIDTEDLSDVVEKQKALMDPAIWDFEHARLVKLGMPPALAKAVLDPFDYYLRTISGVEVYFESAEEVNSEWVRLLEPKRDHFTQAQKSGRCQGWHRGLEVRISEIAMCADAPFGS